VQLGIDGQQPDGRQDVIEEGIRRPPATHPVRDYVRMTQPTRLQGLRPFAIRFVNPITRLVAGWLPGFGILQYRGRKTGKAYRTPMNLFRRGDHMVFALTYGSEVQWLKNVLAAGELIVRTTGRDVHLVEPELFHDPTRRDMPALIRPFLGFMRVSDFLRMRIAPG
jgi:deazaflavin-dependent oxidoreductase (nitroreductase family)